METLTLYLRTALFSPNTAEPHLPPGVAIIQATVVERGSGGILIDATAFHDTRGQEIEGKAHRLFVPWSKVDHAVVHP